MIISQGHNGLNHWRDVKQEDGVIVNEVSDDGITWHSADSSGAVTKLGALKRDAVVTYKPITTSNTNKQINWLWIAGAFSSGGLLVAAVEAAIRIWGGL